MRQNGYKILYRNFRGRSGGEIDLVCRDGDTLVFVEVKTRTREDFGRPFDAVGREKQKRISRGGLAWLRLLDNPEILFRFDVVEVIIAPEAKPRLELLRNAFELCPSPTSIDGKDLRNLQDGIFCPASRENRFIQLPLRRTPARNFPTKSYERTK